MANTTFNTRIQLKYDLYSVWTTQNPVLLKGELAIAEIPSETGVVQNEPAYLLKVGDGVKKFNELEWISGKAADVYAWAKAATKPTYQASEIQGLDAYISGKVQDTNTKYQIVKNGDLGFKLQFKELNGQWTDQDDITLVAPTYSLLEGETNGTVKFGITGSEAEVKVHGLGSAAYTESSAYDPAGTAAGVQTAVIGTSGDQSSAITIYGTRKYAEEQAASAQSAATSAAKSYTDGQITQAKTDLIGTGDATSTTIKGAVAESKTYADTQIAAKIGSVYKPAGSVAFEDLPTPAANLLGNVYNVTNAFTADAEFITGEQGTKYPAGTNVVVVEVDDAYYYDALTGIVDLSSYATQSWVTEQLETQSETLIGSASGVTANTIKGAVVEAKGYADTLNTAMDGRVDALETNVGGTPVATQIQTAIQALDKADSAVANQFVTSVSETNGVVAVTRAQPQIADVQNLQSTLDNKVDTSSLADIATTGNVNDLIQTPGDWIVFNCGSSTVNI